LRWIEVEVGEGFTFDIVAEVNGFWINYRSEDFEGWKPSRSELKWVTECIRNVMADLRMEIPHFALEIVPCWGLGTRNPTCVVDKRKEIIYLRLPIDVVNGTLCIPLETEETHEDYVFYHELMHAKDILEGRFPSSGFINPYENPELALITSLSHFSLEGRLEKMGKPHKDKRNVIENEYLWASRLERAHAVEVEPGHWQRRVEWSIKECIREEFEDLCDRLWGKEVTFQELQSVACRILSEKT